MAKIIKCPICGCEDYVLDKNTNEAVCRACGESFKLNGGSSSTKINTVEIKDNQSGRKKFFNKIMEKVVDIHAYHNNNIIAGTAFFINNEYALTNAHVVFSDITSNNAFSTIAIQINGSNYEKTKRYTFDVVNADFDNDIAILKLQEGMNSYASFAESAFNGEEVYAIGNSRGDGLCILEGIISDAKRVVNGKEVIMTSALVTNGNSGGPIFNTQGLIVGMIAMSSSKSLAMNYAIPVSTLKEFIKQTEIKEEINIL